MERHWVWMLLLMVLFKVNWYLTSTLSTAMTFDLFSKCKCLKRQSDAFDYTLSVSFSCNVRICECFPLSRVTSLGVSSFFIDFCWRQTTNLTGFSICVNIVFPNLILIREMFQYAMNSLESFPLIQLSRYPIIMSQNSTTSFRPIC